MIARTIRRRRGIYFLFALAVLAQSTPSRADELMAIPVIINLYQNSGTTKAEAEEAVKEASRMLKQLGVKLVIADTREGVTAGDDGAGGGTAGDSSFTQQEFEQVIVHGKNELLAGPDKKGLKIVFAQRPNEDAGPLTNPTPGASTHREPAVLVKNQGDANKTGQIVVHEFGHIVTLAEEHQISATVESDDHGHAPNIDGVFGKLNAMAPGNYRAAAGTPPTPVFTTLQKQRIADDKVLDGMSRTVIKGPGAPGVKKDQQDGISIDPVGDQAAGQPGVDDLISGTFTSSAGTDLLQGRLLLGGTFPTTGSLTTEYLIDFESNPLFAGPESQVHVFVGAFNGTIFTSGSIHNLVTDQLFSLPSQLTNAPVNFDSDIPPIPMYQHLLFDASKTAMGLDALVTGEVEISITSGSNADALLMQMDMDRASDVPTLDLLSGDPMSSGPVPMSIAGLTPDSPFDVYLDETLLFSGLLDGTGAFGGTFALPTVLPGMYFLTAQDATGLFAFNVIEAVPEPSSAAMLAALWSAVIGLRARRRPDRLAMAPVPPGLRDPA